MANTSALWQQAAHTTYQLSSPSCSTRAIQKSLTPVSYTHLRAHETCLDLVCRLLLEILSQCPEGRPGMSDVPPLSGISGL